MPFWKPGSLSDEDAWSVTAFIARQNGFWTGIGELSESNTKDIKISRGTPTPGVKPQPAQVQSRGGLNPWLLFGGILLVLVIIFFVLKKSQNTTTI
jgi:hypothetical protein